MIQQTILLCFAGAFFTALLGILLKLFVAPKHKFKDFLVGELGSYSLSRLQAFLWGFIIISYQVSVYITMCYLGRAYEFKLVFSQEVMWLLGISLGVYVTVKGITNRQAQTGDSPLPNQPPTPKSSDYITDGGKLDFSRFQMLIWTIFALVTFIGSYGYYIYQILGASQAANLNHKIADLSIFFQDIKVGSKNILPSIDMSFIVLTGLSQGAYIGQKLVPSFKTDEFVKDNLEKLQQRQTGLEYQQKQYELLLLSPSISDYNKAEIQKKLAAIKSQQSEIEADRTALKQQGS